LKLTNIIGDMT